MFVGKGHMVFVDSESSLEVKKGFKKLESLAHRVCIRVLNKSPDFIATAKASSFGKHFIFMLSVIRREKLCFADEMVLIIKSRSHSIFVSRYFL